MAQLLLQQGKVTQALEYFERAAELSRTEGEIVNALSYAEATRTQLEVSQKYPQLQARLQQMGAGGIGGPIIPSSDPRASLSSRVRAETSRRRQYEESSRTYDDFEDLVMRMLTFDPSDRIRPMDALRHPFITESEQGGGK